MVLCIFEDDEVGGLFPLARTRAVYELRIGRSSLLETIAHFAGTDRLVLHCRPALAATVGRETGRPVNRLAPGVDVLFLNGRIVANAPSDLAKVTRIVDSGKGVTLLQDGVLIAAWLPASEQRVDLSEIDAVTPSLFRTEERNVEGVTLVSRMWHLLDHIGDVIESDFKTVTKGYNVFERPGAHVSGHAHLVEGERIYVGPGATINSGAILDATEGPILVDRNAVVLENAVLRGPVSIGEHSQIKVGSAIESSTVGPWCKVGGEVHGSIVQSYSNKAHPGYLGDSILGSWCNIGAATNTSNLRNDYGNVAVFNEVTASKEDTGRIFAGLFMGDHSKCGIQSMFNTGTVIGVFCNLFGAGYNPRFVPSFTWGGPDSGFSTYRLEKAMKVARAVMARRGKELDASDELLLQHVFEETALLRESGPIK